MNELGVFGSAEANHRDVIEKFANLCAQNPQAAQEQYNGYLGAVNSGADTDGMDGIVSKLFKTNSDQYIIFGEDVNEATKNQHKLWLAANQSSHATPEEHSAAKDILRRARVATYINFALQALSPNTEAVFLAEAA